MRGTLHRSLASALLAGLVLLGTVYTSAGVHRLVADVPGSYPVDLRLRWWEERLFASGLNPQRQGHDDPMLSGVHESMRHIGGSYPPWSYTIGLLLVPPFEWTATRWYFATLSLLSMGLSAFCAHRWCRASGRMPSAIAAATVFAVFPSAICISYGQYAVPILGLQVLAIVALDSNRPLIAGVLLGLALVKPQLTMLCVLALAAGGSPAAGITAGLVAAIGTLVMSLVVGEAPWAVLVQSLTEAVHNAHNSQNPLPAWLAMLTGSAVSTVVVTLCGVVAAIVAARLLRGERSRLPLAAAAAILAMFWSSRKHMDVPIMTLPLVLVGLDLARTRRLREATLFALLGLTLWAPLRDDQWALPVVVVADTLIWLAAGWYILFGRAAQRWTGEPTPVTGRASPR
jgi:hypothetical protein